jgi:hypothetical protein
MALPEHLQALPIGSGLACAVNSEDVDLDVVKIRKLTASIAY